ncbi:hypothetical protein ACQKWADRAFT_296053 [Trichoderma austrokoningii]
METTVLVRSPNIPSSPAGGGRCKRIKTGRHGVASNNETSAAHPRPDGVNATIHGAQPQPSIHLWVQGPTDAAYMFSSPTSSAGVTETSRVPVADLSAPASGQLSLNGLPPAYQPQQPFVGNTSGGPGPAYSLRSDNRFQNDQSVMPIQNRTSAEVLNAYHSQQFQDPGQPNNFGHPQPHPQQVYVFHGLSASDTTTTNTGGYQQYQHSPAYTALQESDPLDQQFPNTNLPYPAPFNHQQNTMGGGQYDPRISRQTGINEDGSQAPRAGSPTLTGYGGMLHGATQAQNWVPEIISYGEPRQHSRAEPSYHFMSDNLEELDNADIDVDASGSSPEAIVEPLPSLKRSSSQLASGPLPRRPYRTVCKKNEFRKVKACVRCRMQKIKCVPDSTDVSGDCLGCRTYSKTSKKTIHRMPCYRGKITDAVLFRSGGLQLTNRWRGTDMKDVGDRVDPTCIRTIYFTLGISTHPIIVDVTEFRPREGDVVARFWTVPGGEHGVRLRKDLSPFCLADIHKTAAYYQKYIEDHALEVFKRERTGGQWGPRDPMERTYRAAMNYYQDLASKPYVTQTQEKERDFLKVLFHFWFALRHSTGSSWICGDDCLEMKPETRDESYPLFGRVSVPRMILAQFDSINTHLLHKYGKKVLSELEGFMSRGSTTMWYTVYLCLYILLREASWLSEDRYRHARSNYGPSVRYSVPVFVEQLQDGCNNLLQHWHYYNPDGWPGHLISPERYKSGLAHLSSQRHGLVLDSYNDLQVQKQLAVWEMYKEKNGQVEDPAPKVLDGRSYQGHQCHYDWDHPYYWVAQLFEEKWEPHPTYVEEPLSQY